jgi:hypothetical protein
MKAKKVLRIADRLDREITFASGLSALARGLECVVDQDHLGLEELVEVHIERLQAIRDDLATAMRK